MSFVRQFYTCFNIDPRNAHFFKPIEISQTAGFDSIIHAVDVDDQRRALVAAR